MSNNSKFQKRHYEAIAELFRMEREALLSDVTAGEEARDNYRNELYNIENLFVNMFKADNANFDTMRFLKAVSADA